MKEERKLARQAEEILCGYGEAAVRQDAALFDAILAKDENYQKHEKLYGRRRYRDPKKQILRYAAILLVALFVASIAVPVPQASAWRIWWLDLITGESDVDVQVDAENAYDFVEYYPGKLPEGFRLVSEKSVGDTSFEFLYENSDGKYIKYKQQKKEKASTYFDNEKSSDIKKIIDSFEVIVSYRDKSVLFEFATEQNLNYIRTNAEYEIGEEFIENLVKK